MLPPKPAFLKFTTTPGVRAMTFTKQVFQDIVLPINQLERQIDVSEELFDAYPILVYPCRIYDRGQHTGQLRPPRADQMCPGADWAMFNDLGVYGVPGPVKRKQRYDAVSAMRKMEKCALRHGRSTDASSISSSLCQVEVGEVEYQCNPLPLSHSLSSTVSNVLNLFGCIDSHFTSIIVESTRNGSCFSCSSLLTSVTDLYR